jgi:hypothetical protein
LNSCKTNSQYEGHFQDTNDFVWTVLLTKAKDGEWIAKVKIDYMGKIEAMEANASTKATALTIFKNPFLLNEENILLKNKAGNFKPIFVQPIGEGKAKQLTTMVSFGDLNLEGTELRLCIQDANNASSNNSLCIPLQ